MDKCDQCGREKKVEPYFDEGFQEIFNFCGDCRKSQEGEKNG